jgi:YD repeat-containing protein
MKAILALVILSGASAACAQNLDVASPTNVTDQNRTAQLPFSSSISSKYDSVDLSTGNLSIRVPLLHVKGRAGDDYNVVLRFEGNFWIQEVLTGGLNALWVNEARNPLNGLLGWELNEPYMSYLVSKPSGTCGESGNYSGIVYSNYILTDADGTKHTLDASSGSGTYCRGSYYFGSGGPDVESQGMWIGESPAMESITTDGYARSGVFTSSGDALGGGPIYDSGPINQDGFGYMQGMGGITDPSGSTMQLYPGGTDTLGRVLYTTTEPNGNEVDITFYDANGTSRVVKIYTESISIETDFGAPSEFGGDCYEASGTATTVSSILLPNGQSYSFQYDSYGMVTQMTVPTGGTIQYQWSTLLDAQDTHRYVSSRKVTVGSTSYPWQIALSLVNPSDQSGEEFSNTIQTVMTDPNGNETVNQSEFGEVTSSEVYNGSAQGTPARQYAVSYSAFYNGNNFVAAYNTLGLPVKVTTTLDNGLEAQTQYDYDQYTYAYASCEGWPACDGAAFKQTGYASRGNILAVREYGYGQGAPGSLMRQTINTYLATSNANYFYNGSTVVNIVNRLSTSSVYDGSVTCYGGQTCGANLLAQTTYTYDNNGTNYRGLVTTVSKWLNTTSSILNTQYGYDSYGDITSMTDPLGNVTNWSYTDSWAANNGNCVPSSNTSAYVTLETNALGQRKEYTYEPCTGQPASYKNENDIENNRAGTLVSYDLMGRVIGQWEPDGGYTAVIYNDSANTVEKQSYLSGSAPAYSPGSVPANPAGTAFTDDTTYLDGMGRATETMTVDPFGDDYVDTSYDFANRKLSQTNPFRSTSDPTYGTTTYQYDELGRKILLANPDGSTQSWAFSGNVTTFTDENGNQWSRTTDALGRLTTVLEPSGSARSPSMETDYSYDNLDNLLSVTQEGIGGSTARMRSFTYDSLSRLVQAFNPESGWLCYGTTGGTVPNGSNCTEGYDGNGNLLSKTDARGIATTYTYDSLNRVLSKTFTYDSSGTPWSCYQYDTAGNGKGLLGKEWTLSPSAGSCGSTMPTSGFVTASAILSYDPMGRIWSENQYTPAGIAEGTSYPTNYTYDLAGNVTSSSVGAVPPSMTFSSPSAPCTGAPSFSNTMLMVVNCYDGVGRLSSVASNAGSGPDNLFTAQGYSPFNGLTNAIYGGNGSGNNQVTLTRGYDTRLRITYETDFGNGPSSGTNGSATVTITGAEQSQ